MARNGLIYLFMIWALCWPAHLWAAMSSTDYTIYADSVGVGGDLATGGVYSLEDTLGESPIGFVTNGIYEVRGGYQAMERGTLTLSIADSSLSLGTLSESAVSEASTTVTVVTDASTGYSLSVSAVSGTSVSAVADGTVSAGAEEYGVAVSGVDAAFGDDQAVAASLVLATAAAPATGNDSELTFKASISGSTAAGSYSQTVTLAATANF